MWVCGCECVQTKCVKIMKHFISSKSVNDLGENKNSEVSVLDMNLSVHISQDMH